MFIAGIVVGGVIAGAVAHGDHSDYGDWSEYSDAGIKADIEQQKAELKELKRNAERQKDAVREDFDEYIDGLQDEYQLSDADVDAIRQDPSWYMQSEKGLKKELQEKMEEKLQADIADDTAQLKKIDSLIVKINQMKLEKK